MTKTSITPVTEAQRKQYRRLVEDAADKAFDSERPLDKDGLQRLIESGGDFQKDIITAIKKFSMPRQFVNEECSSVTAYHQDFKIKGIAEQVKILQELGLCRHEADKEITQRPLPDGADGWFAIPDIWGHRADYYKSSIEEVFAIFRSKRDFRNYHERELGSLRLKQQSKTVKMFEKVSKEQNRDVLVIPAQFGLLHRGRSVRRAREVMDANEFGLGVLAVGAMLLTHPERLMDRTDLFINCAGDEYYNEGDGLDYYSKVPGFSFSENRLTFRAESHDSFYGNVGSASGFIL